MESKVNPTVLTLMNKRRLGKSSIDEHSMTYRAESWDFLCTHCSKDNKSDTYRMINTTARESELKRLFPSGRFLLKSEMAEKWSA